MFVPPREVFGSVPVFLRPAPAAPPFFPRFSCRAIIRAPREASTSIERVGYEMTSRLSLFIAGSVRYLLDGLGIVRGCVCLFVCACAASGPASLDAGLGSDMKDVIGFRRVYTRMIGRVNGGDMGLCGQEGRLELGDGIVGWRASACGVCPSLPVSLVTRSLIR